MMLQALFEYAQREGLGDLDFEQRTVHYQLVLAKDGRFLGLVSLGSGKRREEFGGLPKSPNDNNPGSQRFLVATAMYVLGIQKLDSRDPTAAERSRKAYTRLVHEAEQASGDDGLRALRIFLSDGKAVSDADAELAKKEGSAADKRGNCVLAPFLEDDGTYIHARDSVRRWWLDRRDAERAVRATTPLGRCLVSGRMAPIAETHPKLKGAPFPGTGAPLVAFERSARAYSSQHLEKGANAPISEIAAESYVAAVNHLLGKDGGRRRGAVLIDKATAVVFWTRETQAQNLLLQLFDPPPRIRDAVESAEEVWRGVRTSAFDAAPFYAVTLSSNSGRVVVRDWFESTADAVKRNLDRWFDDLQVDAGEARPMPLLPMLRALEATPGAKDRRGLPPNVATQLFRAAVHGGRLPLSLLSAALERVRLPPRARDDLDTARFDQRARFGIIKAVLRRLGRKEITVSLDESNDCRPYLLGRLFAVLERLQAAAHGKERDINTTIRDRYFGAASRTPAMVFGRLIDLSVHHQKKLASAKKGLSVIFDKQLGGIMAKMPPEGFPSALSLEDQGLFAVGYYHQREAIFARLSSPGQPPVEEAPDPKRAP